MEMLHNNASMQLYLDFQKIFRSLNFGRSLTGRSRQAITGSQMRILSFFADSDVVHTSTISRYFNMSLQNVNNMIHRLEEMGFVKRSKNRTDKRLSDIRLTRKGKELYLANRSEQLDILMQILHNLDPAERKALVSAVDLSTTLLEKGALSTAPRSKGDAAGKHKA